MIKSSVWIDASDARMTLEINREQIEILDFLCGYDLATSIHKNVTAHIPKEKLVWLFKEIGLQVRPVAEAIKDAENRLRQDSTS